MSSECISLEIWRNSGYYNSIYFPISPPNFPAHASLHYSYNVTVKCEKIKKAMEECGCKKCKEFHKTTTDSSFSFETRPNTLYFIEVVDLQTGLAGNVSNRTQPAGNCVCVSLCVLNCICKCFCLTSCILSCFFPAIWTAFLQPWELM